MVVTPTLKAAEVAAGQIDAPAFSAAWLVHQWGWRWDDDGHWTRTRAEPLDPRARIDAGDLLVVDEAGMLDQDTARALLEIVHEAGARVAFMGDRHQLPAVGRGGVLDLADQHAGTEATVSLEVVHRFADPAYAEISLAMRRASPSRKPARPCSTPCGAADRSGCTLANPNASTHSLTRRHDALVAGHTSRALMADSRDQVAALNGAIRDRLVAAGFVDNSLVVVNESGERLGIGDRVATRRNDWHLGVANRQTWTITHIGDATVTLRNDRGRTREIPTWYAHGSVELAYATTVYGAQGDTKTEAHLVAGETTSAASAYVGMTRGRHDNIAHLVADTRRTGSRDLGASAQPRPGRPRRRPRPPPSHRRHRQVRTQRTRQSAPDRRATSEHNSSAGPRTDTSSRDGAPSQLEPSRPDPEGSRHRLLTTVECQRRG